MKTVRKNTKEKQKREMEKAIWKQNRRVEDGQEENKRRRCSTKKRNGEMDYENKHSK